MPPPPHPIHGCLRSARCFHLHESQHKSSVSHLRTNCVFTQVVTFALVPLFFPSRHHSRFVLSLPAGFLLLADGHISNKVSASLFTPSVPLVTEPAVGTCRSQTSRFFVANEKSRLSTERAGSFPLVHRCFSPSGFPNQRFIMVKSG